MDGSLPLVSIVCSISDGDLLAGFHGEIFRVLRGLESGFRFELVYAAGDACPPASIDALAQLDPRIRRATLPAGADALLRCGLENARGDLIVLIDAGAHSPELLPKLLELAKGPCAFVEGVAQTAPTVRRLPWSKHAPAARPALLALLKRDAIEVLRRAGTSKATFEALTAAKLPRLELTFVANTVTPAATPSTMLHRFVADVRTAWQTSPFTLVAYFGAMVFFVGVFLALWFPLQGLMAPNSVWFSWCYLIVLLHILGGSILFALGRLGALATHIQRELRGRGETPIPAAIVRPGPTSVGPDAPAKMAA